MSIFSWLIVVAAIVAPNLAAQQPGDTAAHPGARAAVADSARAPGAGATTVAAAVTPAPDQARGVDAELRAALFDLAAARPLAALDRLEWLRTSASAAPAGGAPLATRADLRFLLAESYYRLGMSDPFRATAQELVSAPDGSSARYIGILTPQLMLDAYRRGDDARLRELAARGAHDGDAALAELVSGLAAYRAGDFAAAERDFAEVRAAAGVYAPYAQYMAALTVLQGDTTRAAQAFDALRPLAQMATGSFGDHVRLTAAELAFQSGQYDAAVTLARSVSPTSGVAARALLTEAWAWYRGGKLDSARAAFASFTDRYPLLPERDQARLMVGQVLLESGHAADAATYFQTVADSVGGDVTALASRAAGALIDAARTLVSAREAGIVFIDGPESGKTLALSDAAGADPAAVVAAYAGERTPPPTVAPRVLTVSDIQSEVDTVASALGTAFPRQLLFTGVAAPADATTYDTRAGALLAADVAVALAQRRLQQQLDAHAATIASLEALAKLITSSTGELGSDAGILSATRDSLGRMRLVLASSRQRVHDALERQITDTRRMAAENLAIVDSVRASLGASASAADLGVLATEAQTAATYQRVADQAGQQLDAAIDRHPAFALRDSLGARLAHALALHDSAQSVLAVDGQLVQAELGVLRGSEPQRIRAARASLASAESARAATEAQLVALLDEELSARATALVAALQHDREAADYGAASAAFFRATQAAATADHPASVVGGPGADSTTTGGGGTAHAPRPE